MKWTCKGSVRGECGITHRSYESAARCCARDGAAVRRAYPGTYPTQAYSDRAPVPMDAEAEQDARLRAERDEAELERELSTW